MKAIVEKVCKEDFNQVYPLFEQLWPNKVLNKDKLEIVFNRGVESNSDELLCIKMDDKIIGFCAYAIVNNFWQEGCIAYIYAMIVDEKCQGQGFGTILLNEAINKSKECGFKRIELDSGFPREKAHEFYMKLGFEKRAYLFSKVL
jgi:GNAT superfamily N-acetyltransferase